MKFKISINYGYEPQSTTLKTVSGIAVEQRGIEPSNCFASELKNLTILRRIDFSKMFIEYQYFRNLYLSANE